MDMKTINHSSSCMCDLCKEKNKNQSSRHAMTCGCEKCYEKMYSFRNNRQQLMNKRCQEAWRKEVQAKNNIMISKRNQKYTAKLDDIIQLYDLKEKEVKKK